MSKLREKLNEMIHDDIRAMNADDVEKLRDSYYNAMEGIEMMVSILNKYKKGNLKAEFDMWSDIQKKSVKSKLGKDL